MPRAAVLVRLLPLAVAVALTCATAAVALPPVCDDPECEGGGGDEPVVITPTLTVAPPPGGVIQDSPLVNINCGLDCSQGGTTYSYTRSACDGTTCDYEGVDEVRLVASGGPSGFSPSWTLCSANSSGACADATRFPCDRLDGQACEIDMYDDTRVAMTWVDTTDPNTAFSSPPAVIGPNVKTFSTAPSDNAGVARVEFSIDGVFVGQDTTPGDGFTFTANPNLYTDGSQHTITARAIDTAGRSDGTPASTNFTVDRSTQVNITAPAAGAHSQSAPQFSFTIEAGASAVCKTMSGASGDTSLHQAACTSSYTPQATSPGEYRVRIASTDAVGNTATVDRAFVIDPPPEEDTTDPDTALSAPPAVIGPNVKTFTATATDNAGVATVQFRIDGVLVGEDTTPGDGYTFTANPNLYTDGSVHTITAKAIDTAGRPDASPDSANFTVDRSTGVNITAPAAGAHSQSAPQFSFTIEAGASAVCKTMSGASGDTSLHQAACTSSYTPQATTPGEYRVRIASTDAVGNSATVDRAFVIDPPTQPTQPGQGEQGGGTGEVTAAAILAGLGTDLEAAARGLARQRQTKLAKARGRSFDVNALTAGTISLVFKGAAGKAKASRTVTIAKGSVRAAAAGRQALRLKLTKAGARLLRRGRRVSGKLTLTFTRPDTSRLSASRKVTLKRR